MIKTRMRPIFHDNRLQDLLLQSPIGIKTLRCPCHIKVPQKTIGTMACPRDGDNRPVVSYQPPIRFSAAAVLSEKSFRFIIDSIPHNEIRGPG